MTEVRTFQRPETVPIYAEVKNQAGSYVDPTSITITITSPTNLAVITDVAMTQTATGKYTYYYRPASNAELGWYHVKVTSVDGAGGSAITTITQGGFTLA